MVTLVRFISVPTNSSDKTNIKIVRSTVVIYESNNNETPVIFSLIIVIISTIPTLILLSYFVTSTL